MLHAILMILGLASVVLALLIMVQAISLQDLFSFTKRGLVAVVVLLVVGCILKSVLVAIVTMVLLPIAGSSFLRSLIAVLLIIALFFIIRLLVVTAYSRHNP